MQNKHLPAIFIAIILALSSIAAGQNWGVNPKTGGDSTRVATNHNAFALPAANIRQEMLPVFAFGNRIFNTNWAAAPASVQKFDGLCPLFNRVSCSGCHLRNGRGRPPIEDETQLLSMLVRASDPLGGTLEKYGRQIQTRAIVGLKPEASVSVAYEEITGKFADGETYQLRKPELIFSNWLFGEPSEASFSARVAPAVFGLGLLEAIPKTEILSYADPDDKDNDGISGRPAVIIDKTGKTRIGRFGWKAAQPSIHEQNMAAALFDIGLTSYSFTKENLHINKHKMPKCGARRLSRFST